MAHLFSTELDTKVTRHNYKMILALARSLWLEVQELKKVEPFPVKKNKPAQQMPYKRQSQYTPAIKSRIKVLSFGLISCQKIADIIRQQYKVNISRSTVNKIINDKY